MKTFAISNQKGGVGKTTSAVTLAHGLARRGGRVLLVDLDAQGNVADSLGLEAGHELADLLTPVLPKQLSECLMPSGREHLDVLRSDKSTAALKIALAGVNFREYALADVLEQGKRLYDVAILDCAPSVDLLHTAALVAADWLLIPTRLDQMAVKGVRDVLESLGELHRLDRSHCKFGGVIPTFYDRQTNETQLQLENLVRQFTKFVLPPVPGDAVCRAASRVGKTLYEHAPACRALIGVLANGNNKRMGGYEQVLTRLEALL